MPNWKKVIVSGSDAELNSLVVSNNITASSNIYIDGALYDNNETPGTADQVLFTTSTGIEWRDNIAQEAQDLVITGKNLSGGTIAKGTPLYFTGSGTSGNTVGIYPADAGNPNRMPAGGVAGESIADDTEGSVYIYGFIAGVDTSQFNAGDDVFVGVGGGYTNQKPTGSALIQKLGNVEKVDPTNGSGVIQGPSWYNDLPNWEEGKVKVGRDDGQPVTSSVIHLDETNGFMGVGTDSPISELHVEGSGSTVFAVDGSSGRLFSITDDLSDSLFSANTIAGLPVLEVFSDNTVKIGTFNDEAIIVNGNTAEITGSVFGTSSYSDNSDLLDGQEGTYYLNYNNFSNTPTIGNGTITISAGTDLTTGGSFTTNQTSGATITINHADTSTLSGLYGGSDNGIVIEDITVDGRGHVTAIGTRDLDSRFAASSHTHTASQITDFDTSVKTKLNTEGVISGSSQVDYNSIQNTPTIGNATITISAGTALTTGGDFTTNQTGNETITINHSSVTRSNTSAFGNLSFGGTFTTVTDLGSNTQGHVTSAEETTFTLPNLPTGTVSGSSQINHDSTTGFVANEHINHANISVFAGNGLSGGGDLTTSRTLAVDLSELTDMTATMVGTDEFIVLDAGADRRKAANEIGLSIFNNDSGFTTNTGTVTSVGGTGTVNGLTLTGTVTTTGNLTLGGDLTINNNDWSGADLSLANGGTGASLSDPNADRILFWDDSAGAVTWLSAGTNITISGTTISATDTNTTYSAGTLLDLSGTTFNVDLSELTTSTSNGDGDYFVVVDTANAQKKLTKANIALSGFNNDSGWTSNTGTVTSVGGTGTVNGLTLTGTVTTSGNLTLGGTLSINNNDWSGADLSLANGGTGASLSDPNGDRILFWDDSAGAVTWLSAGTNITISGTTISATDTNTTYSAGNGITLSSTTFSVAAGGGLTQDAGGLSHSDTSTQASVNNSNGTVIQDVTLDTYGHVTGLTSYNLDGRYYTETEADGKFLLNTTDTLVGDLTVTGKITAEEFHTEFVSASIIYQSGSTKFGDTQDDNHNFTGSVNITGSLSLNGSSVLTTADEGSGNGIDADLLDGQEGSYYRNASNLNAGTISDARLPGSITSDITGNAATATKWATTRTLTIGDTGKSVDGSGNVSWSRTELGITKTNIDALNIDADTLDGNDASAFYLASNPSGYTTNTGTVTSVGGTGTVNGLTLTGTVTTTGNLTLGGTLSINNNDWSGADLSLANGGTGASLTDPGADRILFWDDSAGAVTWLSAGTNITISGTTISATDTNTTYSAGNGITLSSTTFSVAAGGGLTQDAGGLSHSDTSTQSSVNNSNGTVIQDVTLDTYGHVTGLTSYNLDGRYYTETEADGKFLLNTTDTLTGDLTVTAKLTAATIVETSTRELKENIKPLDSQTEVVDSLQPVSYTWKDGGDEDFGLIAEDVAQIAPHLVELDEGGNPKGIKYSKLSVLLLDVVKKQNEQIEELNKRLTKLENGI